MIGADDNNTVEVHKNNGLTSGALKIPDQDVIAHARLEEKCVAGMDLVEWGYRAINKCGRIAYDDLHPLCLCNCTGMGTTHCKQAAEEADQPRIQ